MKKTRIIALAVALLFAVVVNVAAENTSLTKPDFIFRVPVTLHYIPSEAQQVDIHCIVLDPARGIIGDASKKSDIQSHELFSETVVVAVKVYGGRDPQKATKYECELGLVSGEAIFNPAPSPVCDGLSHPLACADPGAGGRCPVNPAMILQWVNAVNAILALGVPIAKCITLIRDQMSEEDANAVLRELVVGWNSAKLENEARIAELQAQIAAGGGRPIAMP